MAPILITAGRVYNGFCRNVRFLEQNPTMGLRNSRSYRLPNTRKSHFATEPDKDFSSAHRVGTDV